MGQLAEAKAALGAIGTETEQAKFKIGLAEKEIKEKEPRAKKAEKEGEGALKELAKKREEVEVLRGKVKGAKWDEGRGEELVARRADAQERLVGLMEVSLAHSMAMDVAFVRGQGITLICIATRRPQVPLGKH